MTAEVIVGWMLILLYAPISSDFSGTGWKSEPNHGACLEDAKRVIGHSFDTAWWDEATMGRRPTIVAAYCARGAMDATGDDAPSANLK